MFNSIFKQIFLLVCFLPTVCLSQNNDYIKYHIKDSLSVRFVDSLSQYKLIEHHKHIQLINNLKIIDIETGKITTQNGSIALIDNVIYKVYSKNKKKLKFKGNKATIVDGNGNYAIPGLCDMHIHNYTCGSSLERFYFLLNGVTTIRDVEPNSLEFDEFTLLQQNALIGPNLYSCWDLDTVNYLDLSNFKYDHFPIYWNQIDRMFNRKLLNEIDSCFNNPNCNLNFSFTNNLVYSNTQYPKFTVFEKWKYYENLKEQKNFKDFWFVSCMKSYANAEIDFVVKGYFTSIKNFINDRNMQFCIGTERRAANFYSYTLGYRHNYLKQQQNIFLDEILFLKNEMKLPNKKILQMATVNAFNMVNSVHPTPPKDLKEIYYTPYNNLPFGKLTDGYRADIVLLKNNPLTDIEALGNINGVFINGTFLNYEDLQKIKGFYQSYYEE